MITNTSPSTILWANGTSIQVACLISPHRWHGECNCLVGPFSSREVAEYFAHPVVDFGHYDVYTKSIFAKRDGWYVEIAERENSLEHASRTVGRR